MKRARAAQQQLEALTTTVSEREARDVETRRLRALAKRVQKAAGVIAVAATYHEDAAFGTARARLHRAQEELSNAVEYIAYAKWHHKEWRAAAAQQTTSEAQRLDAVADSYVREFERDEQIAATK